MNNKKLIKTIVLTLLIILAVGFLITVISAWIPIRLNGIHDLDKMEFGKPFPFLIQKYAGLVPEEWFPGLCTPKFTNGYSTHIEVVNFIFSWILISAVLMAVVAIIRFIKVMAKNQKSQNKN